MKLRGKIKDLNIQVEKALAIQQTKVGNPNQMASP